MVKKRLNIGLDFDNTITEDPKGFGAIVRCFQSLGHNVRIVTLRGSNEHDGLMDFFLKNYGVETIFCNGQAKQRVAKEAGYPVDIWIDDDPKFIVNDYPNWDKLVKTFKA